MERIELWFWMMRSETTGKLIRSPCRFQEAEALRRDPSAVRIPGTLEVREGRTDGMGHSTAFGNPYGPPHWQTPAIEGNAEDG